MNDLDTLRKEIDEIDNDLLILFAKRYKAVEKIGVYKKEHALPITDPKREEEKLAAVYNKAESLGLSKTFVQDIWHRMFQESYQKEA